MSEKLAINGGKPVRETPLPTIYPGAFVYGEEEKKAVLEVLERKSPFRYYGPAVAGKVKAFEKLFTEKSGSKYALGVTSGTAALVVALKALGIGPGDKVIVPANTFVASAGAVIIAGAVPVFADVDDSMNINPSEIGRLKDKYTKAVIPIPILGNPCEMDRVMEEARRHNLFVIEDVAQSSGCTYRGKFCGTFGDIGCFSLQMNKIITTGDGGAVATSDDKLYERAVRYHDQGMFREKEGFLTSDSSDVFVGQNYRMSELSGAIATEQLKKLDKILTHMRNMKSVIKESVKDISGLSFRRITDPTGDAGSTLFMMLPNKEVAAQFRAALKAENITNGYLYSGRPVYMLPQILYQKTADRNGFPFNQFDEKIVYEEGMCPVVEELLPKSFTIAISPLMTEQDADDIIKGIQKIAEYLL